MKKTAREYEIRLTLTKEDFRRLQKNPELAKAEQQISRQTLRSVYYDTPGNKLHEKGLSLRVRKQGGKFVQTVKADTGAADGVSPIEIECPLESAEPDISAIADKAIRARIEEALDGSVLRPAFETAVTRNVHRITTEGSVIELTLDQGETRAGERVSEICEAELELVEGNPEHLLEVAEQLFAAHEVVISPMSKAERGYRLLTRAKAGENLAPAPARPPAITPKQTGGQAFAEILRSARNQITKNRTVVLDSDDPEGAHQLRVGLTRLRTLERVLRPFVRNTQLRQIEEHAGAVARQVGGLRDADVLIQEIYAPVAGRAAAVPGFEHLHRALKSHRAEKQKEARLALKSEDWTQLMLAMTLWPAMLERHLGLEKPATSYARKALDRRWKDVRRYADALEKLTGEEQHSLRKAMKKLRYSIDFFTPLYGGDEVKAYVKQLKKLQDIFGYMNDVRMAGQIRDIAGKKPSASGTVCFAAGYVLGFHEARAIKVWKKAVKEWERLEKMDKFWR